jgi:hypothetical protein
MVDTLENNQSKGDVLENDQSKGDVLENDQSKGCITDSSPKRSHLIEEHLISRMKEIKVQELCNQISKEKDNKELDRLLYLEKNDKKEFDKEMNLFGEGEGIDESS